MPTIARGTINWSGFAGAPGYTNLYFNDSLNDVLGDVHAEQVVDTLDTFIGGILNWIPAPVKLEVDPNVAFIQAETGDLIGFGTGTPLVGRQGAATASSTWSAASGACISWSTGTVRNNRRVRGRTFLVPLAGTAYETNGTLATGAMLQMNDAAVLLRNVFSDTMELCIWGRPTILGNDGVVADVTGHRIQDKAAVLTSRRD